MASKKYNPDKDIEAALKKLLTDSEGQPFDMRCKAINTAIAWEKLKKSVDEDEQFDPEDL